MSEGSLMFGRSPSFVCCQARSKNFGMRLLASSCLSVRHSAWNNSAATGSIFINLIFEDFFIKSVDKIQFSSTYRKTNRYFSRKTMYVYDNISLNCSQKEKCLRQKLYRKSKHTFYVQKLFFFENPAVYEIMWKNFVESDWTRDNKIMSHALCMLDD